MTTPEPAPRRKRGCRYFFNLSMVLLLAILFAYNCIIPAFIGVQLTRVRHPVDGNPADIGGFAYENVSFVTSDGLTLYGWYIPSQNGATVIVVHGSTGNRTDGALHAIMLAEEGYGVLMLDLRGHGNSDGETFNMGWDSNPDLDSAVAYLQTRPDVDDDRIGVLGLSMGAEVALQAAANNPAIQAVVSDGAGARTVDDFMSIPGAGKLTNLAFIWSQFSAHRLATGITPPPPLTELIPQIAPRPILFIMNGAGNWGERLLADVYAAAAGDPHEMWLIPDTGHIGGLSAYPDLYREHVVGFFDEALLEEALISSQ